MIKKILAFFHIDLTKNMEYDRYTKQIMKKVLKPDSNCIDIGCHEGEILDIMLELAPLGSHYGFEPLPHLFQKLKISYKDKAKIYPYALSDKNGKSTFQYVINAPAYSGIIRRKYDISDPDIKEIEVELMTLDDIFDNNFKVDFIKIDVEGGEFNVLKGGKKLLVQNKPYIIFESGLGASEFYGTKPIDIYNYITENIGLRIFTLHSFLKDDAALSLKEFNSCYASGKEYYFIAAK